MSEAFRTRVSAPHGFVHAGVGDIHFRVDSPGEGTRRTSPRGIAGDQLLWLWQRFIHPIGFGEARHKLLAHSTVLLDGAVGSGRTSAARVLLYQLRRDAEAFHELLPDQEEGPLLDPELVGDGDRLLLDLSDASGTRCAEALRDLSSFRRSVRERRAHLVVVLPHGGSDGLPEDLAQHRVELGRPRGLEVLRRHLRQGGVSWEDCLRPVPALGGFLSPKRPIREIARFADLVLRARTAQPDRGFAGWCEQAHAVLRDRGQRAADRAAALRRGTERALLLSTALLHGSHSDTVHEGAALLLRTVKSPEDDRPLLEHEDLAQRLKKIAADRDPDGRVHFDDLDYDTAVLSHFWDHRPDLREHLRTWVGRTVDAGAPFFSEEDRDRLVERLAGQYLRTGRPEELISLVEEWTAPAATGRRLRAAAQALRHGLGNEGHGPFFRKRIYDWATGGQPGEGLVQVLVDVCAEVIAVRHPQQAVVRLHHLARREVRTTRAGDALLELTENDPRLLRLMLHRLALALPQTTRPADPGLFLRIAAPLPLTDPGRRSHALLAETAVREWLVTGWRAVFEQCSSQVWEGYVRRWLHTACEDERHSDLLLDVLVAGAAPRGELLGALYSTARGGQRAAPGGRERGAALTDRLLSKISAAQGLRPTTPPRPSGGTTP